MYLQNRHAFLLGKKPDMEHHQQTNPPCPYKAWHQSRVRHCAIDLRKCHSWRYMHFAVKVDVARELNLTIQPQAMKSMFDSPYTTERCSESYSSFRVGEL